MLSCLFALCHLAQKCKLSFKKKKGLKTLSDMINVFSAFNLIAARQYN